MPIQIRRGAPRLASRPPRRRRRAMRVGAVLALSALAAGWSLAPALAQAAPEPWSQFQGSPEHEGEGDGPAPPYREAWRLTERRGLSGPVIAGDVVAAVGAQAVLAVDLATGEERWREERGEGPLVPPAAGELEDGTLVLVHTAGTGEDASLVARDLETGEQRWAADLRATGTSGVTIADGRAFVGDDGGRLYGFDLETGEELWPPVEAGGRIDAPPAVAEGLVLASTLELRSGVLGAIAVRATSGEEAWRYEPPTPGRAISAVSVLRGRALVGVHAQAVVALDLADGAESRFGTVTGFFGPLSGAASAGSDVVVADEGGGVYRLDGESGDRRWSFQLNERLAAAPVVADGTVVVALGDGRLVAIDLDSSLLVWESETGPGAFGPVAVAADVLVASKGGRRGGLVAYVEDPGGELLERPSPTVVEPGHLVGNFAVVLVGLTVVLFGVARGLALVVTPPGGRLWEDEAVDGLEGPDGVGTRDGG